MLFGMTQGEIALTAFIFLLIESAVLLPRLGERLGVFLARRARAGGTSTPQERR